MSGINSSRLKSKKEKILSLWEERSLKEVPAAVSAKALVLRDSLPLYLDHLSEALATNRKMDITSVLAHDKEGVRIGKLHGADRAGNTSYVLTEVIFEYHILREVIFQILETEGPLETVQRDIIYDSIEQAVNDAAVKFSEVHADIQQQFINTLTHDLKSPITAAKTYAQLILRRIDKPEACLASAGKIVGSLNRLDAMIHNLLDASRIRAGEELSLQLVPCELGSLVQEVMDEMTVVHGDRFTLISQEPFGGYWGCKELRRALENLVGNAVKYSAPESPITVTLRREKAVVELIVHNQGVPIPVHEIPYLFEQYRRAKNAQTSAKVGWGLGLTLVKGVVDAHKGKVRVESEEGRGTSFIVELPFAGIASLKSDDSSKAETQDAT